MNADDDALCGDARGVRMVPKSHPIIGFPVGRSMVGVSGGSGVLAERAGRRV